MRLEDIELLVDIAKDQGVHQKTVWHWCWKSGVKVEFLGGNQNPNRKGVMAFIRKADLDKLLRFKSDRQTPNNR